MDYRDERDALRGRVESLEQQLDEARRDARARQNGEDTARLAQIQAEIAEAEALIHRIRAELAALGPTRKPPRLRATALIVAVAVAVLGIAGASVATFGVRRELRTWGPGPAVGVDPREPAVRAPVAVDYFKNATSVPGMFKEKLGGPARALQVVVYPEYVIAELQDPKKHENVDRYTLRAGAVGEGDPIRLQGRLKTAKDVDEAALDLATVDFAILPRMLAEATAQLPIADARVTHVMLDASRVFQKEVLWDVYVGSARDSGFVSFDTAGHLKKVSH
jgi:hypothetical protein